MERRLKPDTPDSTELITSQPVISGRSPPGFNPRPRPKSPETISSVESSKFRSCFGMDDITGLVVVNRGTKKGGSV